MAYSSTLHADTNSGKVALLLLFTVTVTVGKYIQIRLKYENSIECLWHKHSAIVIIIPMQSVSITTDVVSQM
jgi:hypothetical protein